jgi:hypothetical protein
VVQHLQPCAYDSTSHPSQASTSSVILSGSWEEDLVTFLRACDVEVKDSLEKKKAQEFADELDVVRQTVG